LLARKQPPDRAATERRQGATLTRNTMVTALVRDRPFTLTTRPTPIQQTALNLLGLAATRTR
jgi:hypothetical protein